MKIRTRLILSFALIVGIGFYYLVDWILEDLRPRYKEAVEESLVDNARLLAGILSQQAHEGKIDASFLHQAFKESSLQSFEAQIYQLKKTQSDLRAYVTDAKGMVLFDSHEGLDEGQDYSQWRDVYLTLRGQYGARTSHEDRFGVATSVLHVAAPIRNGEKIIGVVSLAKPTSNINFFIKTAQPNIQIAGLIAGLSVILLGILFSAWFTHPIQKLTDYAAAVRDGKRTRLPILGRHEIGRLGQSFEEMRVALEDKNSIESYVQNLTHELKSPLSAIQGASELLTEDMPLEDRRRFLSNIRGETERVRNLVDRMLELTSLEKRQELQGIQRISLKGLVSTILERFEPLRQKKALSISEHIPENLVLEGEPFLIEQCLINILQNAFDFSPAEGKIHVSADKHVDHLTISIQDSGPGFPDYAMDKMFDKYFSLPRPSTGRKSTGLGLSFVREIVELHHGSVEAHNRSGGAEVLIKFPMTQKMA